MSIDYQVNRLSSPLQDESMLQASKQPWILAFFIRKTRTLFFVAWPKRLPAVASWTFASCPKVCGGRGSGVNDCTTRVSLLIVRLK